MVPTLVLWRTPVSLRAGSRAQAPVPDPAMRPPHHSCSPKRWSPDPTPQVPLLMCMPLPGPFPDR